MEALQQEETSREGKRARVDSICERGIVALVLAILVWSPLALGSAPMLEFSVVAALTAVAIALWTVRICFQRPMRLLWPPPCWAVLVFVLYALARCPLAPVVFPARMELGHVIVYACLFFIIVHNFTRRDSAVWLSMTLVAVGFAVAVFAVVQDAFHWRSIWGLARPDQYLQRASGPFVNPNNMAGYLVMIIPIALAFAIMGRLPATVNVLLVYAALTMMAAIAFSLSRGGIIAGCVAVVVLCGVLLLQRDFLIPALVMLTCAIGVAVFFSTEMGSIEKRFSHVLNGDQIEDDRTHYWEAAWKLFEREPLWGIGPGQYDSQFPSVRPSQVQTRPQFVHNDYINTLCDWGVAGMAIIAAAIGLLFAGAWKTWLAVRKGSNELGSARSDRTAVVVGASVGLVGVMIHCIVDFNLHITADAVTAVALMAVLTGQRRFATERFWHNPGRVKFLLPVLPAVAACYLAVQAYRHGLAGWWDREAQVQPSASERRLACLVKEQALVPDSYWANFSIGEYWWALSTAGNPGWQKEAVQALQWYQNAMLLNRFDGLAPTRCAMVLDWLGESRPAEWYLNRAEENDPSSEFIAMQEGRHYAGLGQYDKAKGWFERSLKLYWTADAYWEEQLLTKRMNESSLLRRH